MSRQILMLVFLIVMLPTLSRGQNQQTFIDAKQAKAIAEDFLACSGHIAKLSEPAKCPQAVVSCEKTLLPCEAVESNAYGYLRERHNNKNGWTVVFKRVGKYASKLTGIAITMDCLGENVRLDESKIFLKYVIDKY